MKNPRLIYFATVLGLIALSALLSFSVRKLGVSTTEELKNVGNIIGLLLKLGIGFSNYSYAKKCGYSEGKASGLALTAFVPILWLIAFCWLLTRKPMVAGA